MTIYSLRAFANSVVLLLTFVAFVTAWIFTDRFRDIPSVLAGAAAAYLFEVSLTDALTPPKK